jgi:predicted transcriptional regulator
MPKVRLHQSKAWLRRKYIVECLTEDEIAELAGVDRSTINRALRKFNLKRTK